jgi:hypothetical protein
MEPVMRTICLLAVSALAVLVFGQAPQATTPRFYPDDPVWRDHDTQDASGVVAHDFDPDYDWVKHSFTRPGDKVTNVRSQNLNTIEEVADSSWYTNRSGRIPLSVDDIVRGPNTTSGPTPGAWTVISAKLEGTTAGFVIRDQQGVIWFLKFDAPGYRGMATGAEMISTKLLWALGYNVPENHLVSMHPDRLVLDTAATARTPDGRRPALRPRDIVSVLKRAARDPDGSYRVLASKRIDGQALGGFWFDGTRPDDPNDYVPHEHRRELRGYGTFAAWLNHVDSKSTNTLDVLVTEGGRTFVKHYLLDFGSTLGSGGVRPREPFEGWEYALDHREALKAIPSFGFRVKPWTTQSYFEAPSVGLILASHAGWDPDDWKPRYSEPSFVRARPDDKFWAARKIQELTPRLIAAAVDTAEYDDPEAKAAVLRFLLERRTAILRKYLTAVNPVIDPRLASDGTLTFENAAVEADVARRPDAYRTTWWRFDNTTRELEPLGERISRTGIVEAPAALPHAYVKVEIQMASNPSWSDPLHVYFRAKASGWDLVGLERMPGGNPPTPYRAGDGRGVAPAPRATW